MANKVVIVTGASSGIGKACAITFAQAGYDVVLAARSRDKLKEVGKQVEEKGREALIVPTDVSKKQDCKKLVDQTIEKFDRLDVLINNAGISMRALFKHVEFDVLEKLMAVNFWGTVYCTKYALPYLLRSKGAVVGVSSIAGFKGLPGRAGYSASKFAMQGLLETIRIETLEEGLHVLLVAPGFTASNIRKKALGKTGGAQGETPMNEKKLMSPETVSRHVLKGIQKRKREIILTRQGKLTVFLNKWLPGFMDKMVFKHFAKEKDSPLDTN